MLILERELFLFLKNSTKSFPFYELPPFLYAHREQRSPRQSAVAPDYMHQHLQARNLNWVSALISWTVLERLTPIAWHAPSARASIP